LLLGALAATAQDDIKRVLAWSTVSQIGYMAGALAVGSTSAALFHVLTHAAFKALLFLAAGAVIHAVGSNLMSRMGGLRHGMPVTYWSFVIGLGALAGLPPLAGFWSKEGILAAAGDPTGPAPAWVGRVVWLSALAGVTITAWYATRLLRRTFLGEPRVTGHDPQWLMRLPVLVLAVPSALLGLAVFLPSFRSALGLADPHLDVIPLALLALGVVAGWRDPPPVTAFARAFYLDELQNHLVVRPTKALARALRRVDERVVDATVEGSGTGALALGTRLATLHRAALPRAVTAVLTAALVLSAVAAIWVGAS
jgi:NADH-quinone oxidoreductase subunit L